MKTNINTKLSLLIAIVAIVTVFMPVSAHAFQLERLIDPLCLFACPDEDPDVTYVTNTNSYNVSSNIESPGSSVSVVTTTNTNPAPATTVTTTATPASNYNYNYNYNTSNPAPVVAPVVAYNPAPVYTSYNSYNTYSQPYIYDTYGYGRYYTPPTYYQTPVYVQSYPAIQASCYTNVGNTSVRIGDIVTWYASVSGGNGSYTYSWSGTDGLYGSGSSINKTYYNVGTKYAVLSVTSGNQTTSVNCRDAVSVYQPTVYYPNPVQIRVQIPVQYPVYTNNGLDIGCYADPSNAGINQPVNWTVEVTGGRAPYTYSWSGTDGLNGNQSSIIKFYNSYGTKSAIISVTSADGRTASRACSNTITIKKPVNTTATTVAKPKPLTPCEQCAQIQANNALNQAQNTNDRNQVSDNDSNDKSSSAFSLAYVPWGWVALLVIFVLFATVMYLLFNRPKI